MVKIKIFKNRLLRRILIRSREEERVTFTKTRNKKPCDTYGQPDNSWQVKEDKIAGNVKRIINSE
jgi:hypothetical protein